MGVTMNRYQRIADMIADEVDAEAGPKTGPIQKAVPVVKGISARSDSFAGEYKEIADRLMNITIEVDDMKDWACWNPKGEQLVHKAHELCKEALKALSEAEDNLTPNTIWNRF